MRSNDGVLTWPLAFLGVAPKSGLAPALRQPSGSPPAAMSRRCPGGAPMPTNPIGIHRTPQETMKIMKMGLKWVVVRSYGLILWENEATRSKMLSKYLRTTGEFIINSKTTKTKKTKSSFSTYIIYIYIYIWKNWIFGLLVFSSFLN